ncbi:MAG: DUF3883 domain-containing protein [Armatimonadetes bacterium]|nr:DUF3883 domain-containing protein [Armatimonadota bacterium]
MGAIALTPNEWLMAQRLGEKYWLYIVTDAKTPSPQLFVTQNPAQNLNPQAKIVRFVVTDWKEAAAPVKLEN